MYKTLHLLAISGSLRHGSLNHGLLMAAAQILGELDLYPRLELEIFDLSPIPLFNMDLKSIGEPQAVLDFKGRIAAADALLIATPEYNASIPGVLKNAIDWASHPRSQSPLAGKPLAILGAGGRSGTVHAQRHLREVARHLDMQVLEKPEILVDRAWEKFDGNGNLVNPQVRAKIAEMLYALSQILQLPALSSDVTRDQLMYR
jgi:chromate reductase